MSEAAASEANRIPVRQVPPFAAAAKSAALLPNADDAEVQNGITVLPAKSFCRTNDLTGHAAPPHQIG